MTNQEVEDYLARNDVAIIPVGPIEMHGLMPLEAEYVLPLGWAIKMAEKADALVFPHFVFLYPGGTTNGKGTFYMSTLESSQLLMNICKQLVRQGFKRFYFVSGHGPASSVIKPVIRELYDEYGIPAMETMDIMSNARAKVTGGTGPMGMGKSFYGLYKIAGQLEDIPLGVVLPEFNQRRPANLETPGAGRPTTPIRQTPSEIALAMGMGNIYSDPSEHSWSPDQPLTEKLRAQYAEEGIVEVEKIVANMDFGPSLKIMNDQIKRYNEELLPKHKELLNFKKYKVE
jgi:creatinine amidohydrolase